MSAAERRRGADAERRVVAWLRDHGHPDARRRLAGNGQAGDIDGVPGLVIEVKDVASSAWPTWCRQAADEARGTPWCVVRRLRGEPDVGRWPCVASLDAAGLDNHGHFRAMRSLTSIQRVPLGDRWEQTFMWLDEPGAVVAYGQFGWLIREDEP